MRSNETHSFPLIPIKKRLSKVIIFRNNITWMPLQFSACNICKKLSETTATLLIFDKRSLTLNVIIG